MGALQGHAEQDDHADHDADDPHAVQGRPDPHHRHQPQQGEAGNGQVHSQPAGTASAARDGCDRGEALRRQVVDGREPPPGQDVTE